MKKLMMSIFLVSALSFMASAQTTAKTKPAPMVHKSTTTTKTVTKSDNAKAVTPATTSTTTTIGKHKKHPAHKAKKKTRTTTK